MTARGKLIVLEGMDASGKRTQAKILAERLADAGKKVETLGFPAYGTSFGRLVGLYLAGKMGGRDGLPPQAAAALFALDRLQFRDKINAALEAGKWIVCDRYTQSNLYQAARVPAARRPAFVKWLDKMEETMPKPSEIILLDVPIANSRKLLARRGRKKDVNEKDAQYLEQVRRIYLAEAKRNGWKVIACLDARGRLKPKEEIARQVQKALRIA